jgi:glycosyltransferase involved in cell wall biosynthesis
MKVAIFNKHLRTMGGGEKHMGAVAEYLSKDRGFSVDIITSENVSLDVLEQKLKVDLSFCNLIILEHCTEKIEAFSAQYDLFINSTYLSTMRPRAKKNVLLMFFPNIPLSYFLAKSKIFKKFIGFLNRLNTVNHEKGFHHREKIGKYFRRKFGNWTDKSFSFSVFSQFDRKVVIYIDLLQMTNEKNEDLIRSVSYGNRDIAFKIKNNVIVLSVDLKSGKNIFFVKLARIFKPEGQDRQVGVFVKDIYVKSSIFSAIGSLFLKIFREFSYYDYLKYYDVIWANSEYTKKWLNKMWGFDSAVLYPLIDVEDFFNEKEKQKNIISVGRFFKGNHNKKHLPMINAFKVMYDIGMLKGWEFHLCGGTHLESIHQEYLQEVLKASEGYPIYIHPDISLIEMRELYAKAMIFWHAAGYLENEKKNPDKFEHFGITTVEAMAAGCIPIVIGKAGQLEIVSDNVNGFLWKNEKELQQKMKFVLNMPGEAKRKIGLAAVERSKYFLRCNFSSKMDDLLKKL